MICVSSAVLMIQVVCDTTPYWLVIVFNISGIWVHPHLWFSNRYRQQNDERITDLYVTIP